MRCPSNSSPFMFNLLSNGNWDCIIDDNSSCTLFDRGAIIRQETAGKIAAQFTMGISEPRFAHLTAQFPTDQWVNISSLESISIEYYTKGNSPLRVYLQNDYLTDPHQMHFCELEPTTTPRTSILSCDDFRAPISFPETPFPSMERVLALMFGFDYSTEDSEFEVHLTKVTLKISAPKNEFYRVPPYDVVVYWQVTDFCNLSCPYCIAKTKIENETCHIEECGIGTYKLKKQRMHLDVNSLMSNLDRVNKRFKFVITGGEPFLISNAKEAYLKLAEKHYLCFHTNLTNPVIADFFTTVDPSRILEIHASLHISELIHHDLVENYITNYLAAEKAGIPITACVIGHPTILTEAEEYTAFFAERGIQIYFDHFIGKFQGKEYPESYSERENSIVMEQDAFEADKFNCKEKLCNAGCNAFAANFNGDLQPCYYIDTNKGNLFSSIDFSDEFLTCPHSECYDSFYRQEPELFSPSDLEFTNSECGVSV